MNGFKDRVAIVTGGSRGIGRAIVRDLAARGVRVAFTWREREKSARELEEETEAQGRRALSFRCDAADYRGAREVVGAVQGQLGPVDFLVNNAGITLSKLLMSTSAEDWRRIVDVNLDGLFNFSRAAIVGMMKSKRGAIVNVSSVSGVLGTPGQSAYSASKAGMIGFTKSLAREVGRLGIRVNALALGFVETDMVSTLTPKMHDEALARIPMGRFARPEEAAASASFLLSGEAAYVTGHVLHVDGGLAA